ncbi:DNA ligase 1-like isoform X2 [Zootermopsis nevadensis]|uniref:Histone-lysine N-methyltransferase eggless n=2 Tax=Zootermopsis nevadensis TaxID=136037 RepID=A0A067R727_ZOONE|nr:DNA ligase 1-like isoform X2 [Zootermopsis nevadensis]XP_021920489.1 DNA ligase 1-like isoform X2 [Zootermopsis nevadensis]XP_021920490.1 DNA ligase 1-like isoform X2 [Zootermopsis nevadensis]KDR19143.1 Histone-lysine N-methyltransferase eggless [Zootermopsis nevadensis]
MDCDDDTHDSASGEKKLPLNSKDIGEPANVTSNIRVAVEENKQSTGSDSLQDSHNIRKKSESDVINTEGSDINYNESEGMEVEKSRSTEESHNVKQAVTNENVTSKKAKSKEFEELNIKEKGEHDETHDRQKKETSDKEEKELEDNHDKKKEEVNEVSKKKKTDIKDIRDKKKNEIENAIDNKLKEIEKMCYGERNETELSDKEKTEIEKEKVEPSDSGKKAEKTSEGGQKVNTRKGFLVRTGSEEYDVDVNETNPYPDHINFVDVDAPNCDSSPMVIDADGDSNDEIVMIGRKKGTRQYRTSANKEKGKTGVNSNRDSSPEVVLQEKFCKRRQEIVINLDDDNDDIEIETIKKKKKKKKLNAPKGVCCCNIECSTPGQDLRSAPVFVLTYYGRKYKKGRAQKVCAVCFEVAMQHYEHLSYLLSQHKPLMTAKFPPRNDTVVLTDSEEGSEEEEPLPDDVLEDLKEKLQEVIESTLEKYDFNYQIEASRNIISNKLDELSVAFRETDDMFTEMQKRMDDLRNEVYKDFVPIIQELPPLIIEDIHCDTSPPVMHLSPPRMMDYFRQQPQYRQQKTLRIKQTSSTPVTPPGLQKQHMGITSPSTSGTGQADTVRKSPIGELGFIIVDFIVTTW